jgi:hypothetical protein
LIVELAMGEAARPDQHDQDRLAPDDLARQSVDGNGIRVAVRACAAQQQSVVGRGASMARAKVKEKLPLWQLERVGNRPSSTSRFQLLRHVGYEDL